MTPLTTPLSPLLQGFFTERLARQRDASPHTIAAYRDSFRLLLGFVHERTCRPPCKLQLQDLDASTIAAFIGYLETERGNSVRTRNARLTAVHSFFHYAALKAPECSDLITRVLAIPEKRFDTTVISYLTNPEIDALLAAPDRSTWTGRRDHALLLLAVQTGLRASEIASLRRQDLQLDGSAWVRCRGKGRKERCTPLTRQTRQALHVWLRFLHHSRGSRNISSLVTVQAMLAMGRARMKRKANWLPRLIDPFLLLTGPPYAPNDFQLFQLFLDLLPGLLSRMFYEGNLSCPMQSHSHGFRRVHFYRCSSTIGSVALESLALPRGCRAGHHLAARWLGREFGGCARGNSKAAGNAWTHRCTTGA